MSVTALFKSFDEMPTRHPTQNTNAPGDRRQVTDAKTLDTLVVGTEAVVNVTLLVIEHIGALVAVDLEKTRASKDFLIKGPFARVACTFDVLFFRERPEIILLLFAAKSTSNSLFGSFLHFPRRPIQCRVSGGAKSTALF